PGGSRAAQDASRRRVDRAALPVVVQERAARASPGPLRVQNSTRSVRLGTAGSSNRRSYRTRPSVDPRSKSDAAGRRGATAPHPAFTTETPSAARLFQGPVKL